MAKNKKNRESVPPAAVPLTDSLSSTTQFLAWISLGWALWAIYAYWTHFPWLSRVFTLPGFSSAPIDAMVFVRDLKAVVLLFTVLAGTSAAGSYLLRLFKLNWKSPLEEWVFAQALGLGAAGYVILALGAAQLYKPPVFWGLWVIGLGLAWKRWFSQGTAGINHAVLRFNQWRSENRSWRLLQAILWVLMGTAAIMAFVPEVFYDAMVYHLGVPNWFLHEGGIHYYPAFHAQFPFLRQMLNVLGLALEGERLAKLLQYSSGPLIIATYYALSSRYSSSRTTLIASLAFFSMPMVQMNLWTSGVDIGLSSFALLAFLAWLNGMTDKTQRTRWFVLTGVLAGFCFATKYPGLLVPAGLCVTTLAWIALGEKDLPGAVRGSVIIGAVMSLVMAPWLLKTWWLTGNPVYPYLSTVLGGKDLLADRLLTFTSDTQSGAKHAIGALLRTPWTATFQEISSFSAPGVFLLGFTGFLFTGLLRRALRTPWYFCGAVFFIVYWLGINSMTDRIRLGIPGLTIGCFLLAHPAAFLYERSGTPFKFLLTSVVAVSAFLGALSTYPTLLYSYVPWNVLAGKESTVDYLSYTHPGLDPHPATRMMVYARSVMQPGNRLLIPGDEKMAACPVPFIASGVHNISPLVQWTNEARSVEDLVQAFKRNKVSHMMVNSAEALRLTPYKILDWNEGALPRFNAFSDRHLRLVKSDQIVEPYFENKATPVYLYEFSETPLSGPPAPNALQQVYEQFHAPRS